MIDINYGKLKSGVLVKNVNIMVKNIIRHKKSGILFRTNFP
jgi:hypothetical protein